MSVTYTKSVTVTQYASAGWTYINFDAITPAAGETFVRWKAEETPPAGQIELRDLQWNPRTWGNWYTDRSQINCSADFSHPKIQARLNTPSGTGILNTTYTLTLEFEQTSHNVTVTAGTGGTAVTSKASAQAGETVTITCSPTAGYAANTPTATGITFTAAGTNVWTFAMPAADVAVSCTFSKIAYTITTVVSPTGAGTITAPATAYAGDEVTLSQTPATDYILAAWDSSPQVTIQNSKFTMPAGNITIVAYYLKRSTCTLSSNTLVGGGTVQMNITPGDFSYWHKYKITFDTGIESDLATVPAGTTNVTIQIPENWSNNIPNATTKSGVVLTLETYSGTTGIASYELTGLTYEVPASAVPTVSAVTTSIARTIGGITYQNIGDYYVQNKCGVRAQASASGALSSTIASMEVTMSGYTDNDHKTTVSAASVDFTSGLLSNAGACTITVKATDSRGRTATATATITVQPYNRPGGTLIVKRVDANGDEDLFGTYADYELTKSYTQIGSNTLTWSLTSQGSTENSPADSGHLLPSSRQTFAQTTEYLIKLTLTDSFNETTEIQVMLPTAQFMIYVDKDGERMAFMKASNNNLSKNGKDAVIEFSGNAQIYIGTKTLEQFIQDVVNGV